MLLKYIKGRNKKKERSPLQVNKNNQITVEELIKEFKNILDNYGDLNKKSCLPWFFGGRLGQTGKDRLKLAEELPFLRPENNMYTANRKEVLKQICQFYHDETNKSIWASRLLDPIGDLIDKALGISYSPGLCCSTLRPVFIRQI